MIAGYTAKNVMVLMMSGFHRGIKDSSSQTKRRRIFSLVEPATLRLRPDHFHSREVIDLEGFEQVKSVSRTVAPIQSDQFTELLNKTLTCCSRFAMAAISPLSRLLFRLRKPEENVETGAEQPEKPF